MGVLWFKFITIIVCSCCYAVWTWGGNFHGQCATGSKEARCNEKITKIPNITSKIKQVSLDWNSICWFAWWIVTCHIFSILFLQIACGLDHTLLLSTDGTVMSCGWGADGQTGTVYNSTINALFHCSNVKHVQV